MTRPTLYHNPRCSKSRQTLALLRERGADVEIIEYLREPPSRAMIEGLIEQLGIAAHELVRDKERKELDLPPTTDAEEVVAQILQHPKLMQRPILTHNGQARIGRPPERVLEIL